MNGYRNQNFSCSMQVYKVGFELMTCIKEFEARTETWRNADRNW